GSRAGFRPGVVALVPAAGTPAGGLVVGAAARKAIMVDAACNGENFARPPVEGRRLFRDILAFLSARTPEMYRYQFANPLEVLPWLKGQEDVGIPLFDANDYIYQSWAYETHDVGTTPGMSGDYAKALRGI